MILPKGSFLKPKLVALLNTFEETLAERFRKLKLENRDGVLSLSWMRSAMKSICETHIDIKSFITELELPVCDWDDKWIDVYLDNSVRLLDICIAFSSEFSRLSQGHLLLQCALHSLQSTSSEQFVRAHSSLDGWRQHISRKNPKLENCCNILDGLVESLNLPKVKNSGKGKVLMRAMYGVKVSTVFICSLFVAAFSSSAKTPMNLQIPSSYLWSEAFTDLQTSVNGDISNLSPGGSNPALKDLGAVDAIVKKLHPMIQDGVGSVDAKAYEKSVVDLVENTEELSQGLDLLSKEVDCFFHIVLTGRDALLCNLRGTGSVLDSVQDQANSAQAVV